MRLLSIWILLICSAVGQPVFNSTHGIGGTPKTLEFGRVITTPLLEDTSRPLMNSIVAWYSFESGAITVDSSGNGNTLTAGGTTTTTSGVRGASARFTQASNRLYKTSMAGADLRNPAGKTILYWRRATDTANTGTAGAHVTVGDYPNYPNVQGYAYTTARPTIRIFCDSAKASLFSVQANASTTDGAFAYQNTDVVGWRKVWQMEAILIDSSFDTVRINVSMQYPSVGFYLPQGPASTASTNLIVGALNTAGNGSSFSDIDELAIWNRKLSREELSYIWNGGHGRTYHEISTASNTSIQNPNYWANQQFTEFGRDSTLAVNNITWLSYDNYGNGVKAPNGDLLWIGVREREHADEQAMIICWRSTDNGLTWPTKVVISAENGKLQRNAAAGSAFGKVFAFWENASDSTTWVSISSDNGTNWSAASRIRTRRHERFVPFGPPVVRNDTIFQSGYAASPGSSYVMQIVASSDSGNSWAFFSRIDSVNASSYHISENSIADIGGGRMVCVARTNDALAPNTRELLQYSSTDFGQTWARVGPVWCASSYDDNVTPFLLVDGDSIHLAWMARVAGLVPSRHSVRIASSLKLDVLTNPLAWNDGWRITTESRDVGTNNNAFNYPTLLRDRNGRMRLFFCGNRTPVTTGGASARANIFINQP